MAITTTFKILKLNVAPSKDGLTDVVVSVVSQVISTDGTYSSQGTFTDNLNAPDPNAFVPYPNLTEATVLGWIPAHGSDQKFLDYLASDITNQAHPPVVPMSVPW